MNFNIMRKSCPACSAKVNVGFWQIRENIKRCSNCGALLIENPTKKLVSGIVFFIGGFMATGSKWLGIPIFVGLLIMIISIIIALKIINFKIIKRDLIIRNKKNNQISFINKSDWMEIVNNSVDSEINFEIVEQLNNEIQ